MALMMGKLHEALVSAGVEAGKAREAAEEVASFENRLAKLEADVTLLKWMVGTNILLTLGTLWKVLTL
jgi:hypothetical protein